MWHKDDRVKLKEGHYYPTQANPCIGSEFECAGTVVTGEPNSVSVIWDNGKRNGYSNEQLVNYHTLPEGNPNREFSSHRKENETKMAIMKEIFGTDPEDEYKAEYYFSKYYDGGEG